MKLKNLYNRGFIEFPFIDSKVNSLFRIYQHLPSNSIEVVLDGFAGSHVVSHYFKQLGLKVYANDVMKFSSEIGKSFVENSSTKIYRVDLDMLFSETDVPSEYRLIDFSEEVSKYFSEEECKLLNLYRYNLNKVSSYKASLLLTILNHFICLRLRLFNKKLKSFLFTSSVNKNTNIDSNGSLGLRDFILSCVKRYNLLVFNNDKENKSYNLDILDLLPKVEGVDLLYLDPPKCSRGSYSYRDLYFVPEMYSLGRRVSGGYESWKRYRLKGEFSFKRYVIDSYSRLFALSDKIPYWVISYRSDAYPSLEELYRLISSYRKIYLVDYDFVVGKKKVKEYMFICSPKKKVFKTFSIKSIYSSSHLSLNF